MAASEELVLLERVFLRIGSAETDEQLQSVLAKFLPPVILKLASQTDGVRKKVMELLVHVNKRLKSRSKVQLPVKELIQQYQDPEASPFVTNFTSLYIKMGFPRLEPEIQSQLLPFLLSCIEGRPQAQQDSLMQLVIPVLQYVKFPPTARKGENLFGLDKLPVTNKLLLEMMLDVLFLPYSVPIQAAAAGSSGGVTTPVVPPGLSESAYKRAVGDTPLSPEQLEKVKLGIVNVLGEDLFPEKDIVCHLVVALADTRHSVVSAADRELKKITGSQDWNSPEIINKLYAMFQGTVTRKGQTPAIKPDQKRTPASIPLRMKIMPYFIKSREAVNYFPDNIQVVFDCLFGVNTNTKLKMMAVQFVHHMTLNSSEERFNPISPVLLSGMVKLVGESKEDSKLRSLAYVAVGKIVSRNPALVAKDIALVQTFFDAMTKEDPETRLAVQEALSLMAPAFKMIDSANVTILEALIMQNIEKPEPQARLVAVQYASAVFPADHIPSRYILLLAAGDLKEEVHSEATKALRQKEDAMKARTEQEKQEEKERKKLPPFTEMIKYIQERSAERLKGPHKYVTGNNVLPFNPSTYVEMLVYIRMCLAGSAGVTPDLDSATAMREQAPAIAKYVGQLLTDDPGEKGAIGIYIHIIRQLLTAIGGAPAMYCLLEVVAVARAQLAPQFVKHLDWIKGFVVSSREDMREFAAELYAVVIAEAENPAKQHERLQALLTAIKTQALEGQHGSLLALGFLVGSILSSTRRQVGDVVEEDMDTDDHQDESKKKLITKALVNIAGHLDGSHMLFTSGACSALAEISRNGPLALEDQSENKKLVTKLSLVENLIGKLHSTKEHNKVREKAAIALGFLCVGEAQFPHRQKVIKGLLDSAQPKQVELHFTIGDALVDAALGQRSAAARDVWAVSEEDYKATISGDSNDMVFLIEKLLSEKVTSANPHIRQAACIWLLSVTKKCCSHPAVQSRITNIQSAFMQLLADNDDLTQDIASKGLGVVYDSCSQEQRDELVAMLVDTLMTGKRAKQEVTGDTQLFQEGQLGKTPDGKNLNTYKELCSIANDLNQPDLVYKFMHLANHNAIWNSRRGAAFGFSTIAAQAGEQLAPHLHKIIPKLYRYQFDPNARIQTAMHSIWEALVTDPKKTVEKYIKEIMADLLGNLTNNQWRVRESSCLAVNDLLRGRTLDDVVDKLGELLETLFRVRDDIKESVRNAAEIALKTLSRVCIRLCDATQGKVGVQTTTIVLPVLLKAGLGSPLAEVRALSLSTILKISKTAGELLKPHIPVLAVALLEALSTLEPQQLNYLSLRVSSNQASADRLDSARIAASKTSPMMETLKFCVQYVDADVLTELVPRLTDLIRSGVGLGTKAGCSTFIISLTQHCSRDLTPHAGKLLSALLTGLNDRNPTIRKCYADCIGNLVKVSKDSSVEKLILRLKSWYLEKEDESVLEVCGQTLRAINQYNPDVLKRHAALALPLAFLAMHHKKGDESSASDSKQSVWEEVWLDATPGTEAGIRLYLTELTELTQVALQSQSWAMKAEAASAMNTMASKLGSNLGPPQLGHLLTALLSGLAGRTWTGKGALLQALKSVCVSCKSSVASPESSDQPTLDQVLEAVMKECKKESIPYKMEALRCAGPILESHQVDRFKDISGILQPLLSKKSQDDNKAEAHDVNKDTWLDFEACAYECLGQAWPSTKETQDAEQEHLCNIYSTALQTSFWRVQLAIVKSLRKFFSRLLLLRHPETAEAGSDTLRKLIHLSINPICDCLSNSKYSAIRTESLGLIEELLNKLTEVDQMALLEEKQMKQIQEGLSKMSEDSQPELQAKASTLLKSLMGTS